MLTLECSVSPSKQYKQPSVQQHVRAKTRHFIHSSVYRNASHKKRWSTNNLPFVLPLCFIEVVTISFGVPYYYPQLYIGYPSDYICKQFLYKQWYQDESRIIFKMKDYMLLLLPMIITMMMIPAL